MWKREVMKWDFLIKAKECCCVLKEQVHCSISWLELAVKVANALFDSRYTHAVEMNYGDIKNTTASHNTKQIVQHITTDFFIFK